MTRIPDDAQTSQVKQAFEAGYWAYCGPASPKELDRAMADCEQAWVEYAAKPPAAPVDRACSGCAGVTHTHTCGNPAKSPQLRSSAESAPTNRAIHDAIATSLQRNGLTHSGIQEAVQAVQDLYRAVPQTAWQCAARKQGTAGGNAPADCDWPGCGCDPAANKVLEAIDEAGFEITKKPAPTPWDAYRNRRYEPVETLAKVIYDAFAYNGPAGTTKPAWTPGGNGTKQDEAREEARSHLRQAGHTPALTRPEQS